jgi:hypothetical protein
MAKCSAVWTNGATGASLTRPRVSGFAVGWVSTCRTLRRRSTRSTPITSSASAVPAQTMVTTAPSTLDPDRTTDPPRIPYLGRATGDFARPTLAAITSVWHTTSTSLTPSVTKWPARLRCRRHGNSTHQPRSRTLLSRDSLPGYNSRHLAGRLLPLGDHPDVGRSTTVEPAPSVTTAGHLDHAQPDL